MTLLRSGSATDTGLVRSVNQDLAVETGTLFAVADGMGGHAGGEVAARLAVDTLTVAFRTKPTGAGLSEAVSEANAVVYEHSLDNPELRGMGTTLTAAALVNEDDRDVIALVNVGDSRSYRFHDGELTQITVDHSLAEEMVRTGEISESEAAVHPHRHILTRALGVAGDVSVDLWRIQPTRGDRFLLCSDGLTNELDAPQITEVLATVPDPQVAADLLVRAARTHGGSDNITVVIVDVVRSDGDEEEQGAEEAVAAVAPDFKTAADEAPPAPGPDDAVPVEVLPGPEALKPKWLDRRRARRKARREARGRRLVTIRTFLFVVILAAIVYGAFYAVRWYDTNAYYVQVSNNELMIYHGRIGGGVLYKPVEVERTGVTTADVPPYAVADLTTGVQEDSLQAAQAYVAGLVTTEKQSICTQTPSAAGCATTSTTAAP
ncbi:MAG: Stp1/IreP family PP2C-type Ser/Thr phosphatase [Acidimicrobiales bacterium]|jgi:protein phosphatase